MSDDVYFDRFGGAIDNGGGCKKIRVVIAFDIYYAADLHRRQGVGGFHGGACR